MTQKTSLASLIHPIQLSLSLSNCPIPSTDYKVLTSTRRTLSAKMSAVILCGKTEQIGKGVIALLQPEFNGGFSPAPCLGGHN